MKINQAQQLQIHFFQKIKEELKTFQSIAGILSDILGLSMDSAYRRIRGETLLSLSELMTVCDYFKVSFSYESADKIEETANFFYKTLCDDEKSIKNVLQCLLDLDERMKFINNQKGANTVVTIDEIPIFYIFEFKELTLFKMKIWLQEMNNYHKPDIDETILLPVTHSLYTNYNLCNVVEIWSHKAIHSLTDVIAYYYEIGYLDRDEAHLLLTQTQQLISKRYEKANKDNINYKLYWNEIEVNNSFMLSTYNDVQISSLKLFSLNSITTYNKKLYGDIHKWILNIIENAALISGTNRRKRKQFFNYMENTIEHTKKVIDNTGEYH